MTKRFSYWPTVLLRAIALTLACLGLAAQAADLPAFAPDELERLNDLNWLTQNADKPRVGAW